MQDINQLRDWLKENNHPVVETWTEMEEEAEEEEGYEEGGAMIPMGTQAFTVPGVGGAGGFPRARDPRRLASARCPRSSTR